MTLVDALAILHQPNDSTPELLAEATAIRDGRVAVMVSDAARAAKEATDAVLIEARAAVLEVELMKVSPYLTPELVRRAARKAAESEVAVLPGG